LSLVDKGSVAVRSQSPENQFPTFKTRKAAVVPKGERENLESIRIAGDRGSWGHQSVERSPFIGEAMCDAEETGKPTKSKNGSAS